MRAIPLCRIAQGAVACLLAGLLGACTRVESGVERIQYSFWGSVEQMEAERRIVTAFEAEHPHIKVDLLPIGARYSEKVQAMMVGHVAPDVIMTEMSQYFDWAARGVLLDVTDDLDALDREAHILPIPRRAFLYRGRSFALPVNCHGLVLYYNRSALAAAGIELPAEGVTWAWLESVSPRFSRRAGRPDAPTDYALILPMPAILLWAWGADLFDDNTRPTRLTINTPAAAEALRYMRRMIDRHYAVPPDIAADQGTFQLFRDGKIAFYFDGRWRTPDFVGKTDFDWDVAPIPAGPVRRMTLHGGTALGIYSRSRHIEAARTFARFYASPRGAAVAMAGGRYVPVYEGLALGEAFAALRPPASILRFSETMQEGASATLLYAPGSSEVATIFAGRMEQALTQRDLPVERVLEGLEGDLTRWLAKFREKYGP